MLAVGSSSDTSRAATAEGSPSSREDDEGTEVVGRLNEEPSERVGEPSEKTPWPSGEEPSTGVPMVEGREAKEVNGCTDGPTAEGVGNLPSEEPSWEDLSRPVDGENPTSSELLAERVEEAATKGVSEPIARKSPRTSAATKILETE